MEKKDFYFAMFLALLSTIMFVTVVYILGIKLPVTTYNLIMNEGVSNLLRLSALGLFLLWLVGAYKYLEFMAKSVLEKRDEERNGKKWK